MEVGENPALGPSAQEKHERSLEGDFAMNRKLFWQPREAEVNGYPVVRRKTRAPLQSPAQGQASLKV